MSEKKIVCAGGLNVKPAKPIKRFKYAEASKEDEFKKILEKNGWEEEEEVEEQE